MVEILLENVENPQDFVIKGHQFIFVNIRSNQASVATQCFSPNRPLQVGLGWGKLFASLWLALLASLRLVIIGHKHQPKAGQQGQPQAGEWLTPN